MTIELALAIAILLFLAVSFILSLMHRDPTLQERNPPNLPKGPT